MKRIREILRTGRWLPEAARAACGALVFGVLGLGLSGCAGFGGDWRRAVAGPSAPGPVSGVAQADGAWSGRWVSRANGHNGRLRCVVKGAEGGEAVFTYRANWAVFSGTFPTRQPVQVQSDGSVRSTGTWRLPGWAGGEYTYDLTIAGDRFSGTWKCARDHGTFEMARVRPERDPG